MVGPPSAGCGGRGYGVDTGGSGGTGGNDPLLLLPSDDVEAGRGGKAGCRSIMRSV